MKLRKIVFVVGLMAIFAMLTPGLQVWAGGGPEPPATATIQEPELWGVVVVYCSPTSNFAVVRVKQIVNCVIDTQTVVDPNWGYGCLDDEAAPLDWALPGVTFFEYSASWVPYIAKVKNFKFESIGLNTIMSFDAQFKFYEE